MPRQRRVQRGRPALGCPEQQEVRQARSGRAAAPLPSTCSRTPHAYSADGSAARAGVPVSPRAVRWSSSSADRLLDGVLVRGDDEIGSHRLLVRVVDTGQPGDLTHALAGVETLDVPLRRHLHWGADVHLKVERAVGLVRLSDLVADVAERRDRRDQHEHAVAGEQFGDPADPADVDGAVVAGVTAGRGEVRTDGVAVERLDAQAVAAQDRLAAVRDGRLPGAGQAGEPHRGTALGGRADVRGGVGVGHQGSRGVRRRVEARDGDSGVDPWALPEYGLPTVLARTVLIERVGTAARPERLQQRPGHGGILARRTRPRNAIGQCGGDLGHQHAGGRAAPQVTAGVPDVRTFSPVSRITDVRLSFPFEATHDGVVRYDAALCSAHTVGWAC